MPCDKQKSVVIGIIYRPNTPPKADLDAFINHIRELSNKINREGKQIILMGDFNMDLLKCNTHAKTNDLVEETFTRGLLPLITKPTRITSHSATLIDHIYSNINASNIKSGIIVTDLSDHFGTFSIFSSQSICLRQDSLKNRSFNNANLKTFRNLLTSSNFNHILNNDCPNESYDDFFDIFRAAFDKAFPLRTFHPKNKFVKKHNWMTRWLVISACTKNKLYVKKLKSANTYNINKYKEFCKVICFLYLCPVNTRRL